MWPGGPIYLVKYKLCYFQWKLDTKQIETNIFYLGQNNSKPDDL